MGWDAGSLGYFIGCLVWAPIAVWVFALLGWAIMGEIDALFGVVGAMLGVALGGAIMLHPNPDLKPYLVFGVFSLVAVFPSLRSMVQKRELAMIDIESIERAYEQLEERPDGFGPKLRIARLIFPRGLRAHAIVIAEEALKPFPRSMVEDELRQVRLWKASTHPQDYRPLRCLECGTESPVGTLFCRKCRAPIMLQYAKGAWTGKRAARRLLAAWVASMAGLVGIPIAATSMPAFVSGVVVSLLLLGAGALVYLAFRPEARTA